VSGLGDFLDLEDRLGALADARCLNVQRVATHLAREHDLARLHERRIAGIGTYATAGGLGLWHDQATGEKQAGEKECSGHAQYFAGPA